VAATCDRDKNARATNRADRCVFAAAQSIVDAMTMAIKELIMSIVVVRGSRDST
jgi:Zn-dependent membrane protease YugP